MKLLSFGLGRIPRLLTLLCSVAALALTSSVSTQAYADLLNINFGAHQSPGLDGEKVGSAAIGRSQTDQWNFYSRDDGAGGWRESGMLTNMFYADGTPCSCALLVTNGPGCWASSSSDAMYRTYIYPFDGGDLIAMLTGLADGSYDIYIYGADSTFSICVGTNEYDAVTTYDNPVSSVPVWQVGKQFARFSGVKILGGAPLQITVEPGSSGYAILSGLQVVRQQLINVNFGAHLSPGLNGTKIGVAAAGLGTNDFWNFYSRDLDTGAWRSDGVLADLKRSDGVSSGVSLSVSNAPGCWANGSSDPMFNTYVYSSGGSAVTVTVSNLPAGDYSFYVYSADGTHVLRVGGTIVATNKSRGYPIHNPPVWQQGEQYAFFPNVSVEQGETATITITGNVETLPLLSGLQIESSSTRLLAPVITHHPASRSIGVGGDATFLVEATGTEPLVYQWLFNGTNIAEATEATLVLTNVQLNQAGNYSVLVSNSAGVATSSNAILSVSPASVPGTLININFGADKSPGLSAVKTGIAATGASTNDFWNFYSRDDIDGTWRTFGVLTNLLTSQRAVTKVGISISNAPGSWANGSTDPMYNTYVYPFDGGSISIGVTGLTNGLYTVYAYGSDSIFELLGDRTNFIKGSYEFPITSPAMWSEGIQYAIFRGVSVSNGSISLIVQPGISGYAIISGLQIEQVQAGAVITDPPATAKLRILNDPGKLTLQSNTNGTHLTLSRGTGRAPIVIYTSTDLVHWTPIFTNRPTLGPVEYTEPNSSADRHRFYMSVEQD